MFANRRLKQTLALLLLPIACCLLPSLAWAGRIYTAQFNAVAVTAQQDFFEIVAPATAIVIIHDIHCYQTSEAGDAAEEFLSVLLKSGQTVSGSGGSSGTAVARDFGDAAFGGTVEINNTAKANTGTIVTHYAWAWNVRIPFDVIFTPETRPILSPSRRATLELATTPADSITMSCWATFEAIG